MSTHDVTTNLWTATHDALCDGRWADARTLLDELGLRTDVVDCLSSAQAYGVPPMLHDVIQDRINVVNARVGEVA